MRSTTLIFNEFFFEPNYLEVQSFWKGHPTMSEILEKDWESLN